MDDELNFGVTLDNGDSDTREGSETKRNLHSAKDAPIAKK